MKSTRAKSLGQKLIIAHEMRRRCRSPAEPLSPMAQGARAPQIVLGGSAFRTAPTLGAAGAATDLRAARMLVNQLAK